MENFQIHTDISLLPANEHEAYLKEGFNGICTGGSAVIQLFSVRYRISEGELITILPQQLVSISEISDDFSMTFFKVDKVMFLDIMSGLGKLTPAFFFYMRKNFYTRLGDNDIKRFLGYCRALDFRGNNDDPGFPERDHSSFIADLLLGSLRGLPKKNFFGKLSPSQFP